MAALLVAAWLVYDWTRPVVRPIEGAAIAIAGFEPVSPDTESRRLAQLAAGAVERTFATNFIETVASNSPDALAEADFTLRGTVDASDAKHLILASIVDPNTGRTLWSVEAARASGEGRELANQLAMLLADVIRCAVYSQRRMTNFRSNEISARIFRYCEGERSRGAQYEQLAALAQALADVAPESAQAQAYLANNLAFTRPEEPAPAYSAARRALELDPRNGAVRWGLAQVADPRVTLARREQLLREGLRLDPDFLWFRNHLGHLMTTVGRSEEGLAFYDEFVATYPLDATLRPVRAYTLAQMGALRQAREEFDRVEALNPDQRGNLLWALRAETLFGDPVRAAAWMEKAALNEQDRSCLHLTVNALRSQSRPGAAEIERKCRGGVLDPAQVLARFGHKEATLRRLAELDPADFRPHQGPEYVYHADFAEMRADPRFMPLLVRFGIPQYWLETDRWPDFCRSERLPYDCRQAARAAVAASRR